MERSQAVDNFIESWKTDFPDFALTVADLKTPHMLIRALFKVFERLGIDRDAILAPPPEESRNESTIYYWDLIPVINLTRAVNHLVMPQIGITIMMTHFLQPTVVTSHSILSLIINLMVFNDQMLSDIVQYEEEIFERTNQEKTLEDRKHKLLELLNEQAEEKGKRAEKMEKLNSDTKQFEEELKQEKELRKREENQELEVLLKEEAHINTILEQKKTHREALMAEVARRRALRVYDADDIKAKAEQATQNLQETEEKLNSLEATLMEKENSLKNLQCYKPSLDQAKNIVDEIMNLCESLKESELGDLDVDGEEGELDMLNVELPELQAQLFERQAVRSEVERKLMEGQARRQLENTALMMALQDAEEKDRKSQEIYKKALQRTEDIKQLTYKYQEEKITFFDVLARLKGDFTKQLATLDEVCLQTFEKEQRFIEDKLKNLNNLNY